MISYKAFTLNISFADNYGNIIFGERPFSEKGLKSIQFKVNENFPSLGSHMKSLSIGNVQIDINDYFMFQGRYQMLFFPYPLFNALKEKVFKKYLNNGMCNLILYIEGKGISCNCAIKQNIEPVIFNFEGESIILEQEKMFIKTQDKCLFFIRTKTGYKNIVLNQLFLSYFISFFDYEEKTITLYTSNNSIIAIKETKGVLYIIISNILLLIIQSIIIKLV